MRANGPDRTAERTTTSALFIHGTPSDGLRYHRPANAHEECVCSRLEPSVNAAVVVIDDIPIVIANSDDLAIMLYLSHQD